VCARSAALRWNPDANLVAHHDDVKNTKFGLEYVSKFDIVLNALDNLSARRHVNRICLTGNVPLIESGSAGYLGQVQVIKKVYIIMQTN
jgi:ubiquitin-like 1-activating enzyme E1 B